jgi:integrase
MLVEIVRDTERRVAGLVDSTTDQLTRPIGEHVEEYRTHLLAKARDEKHISETVRLIKGVVSECRYRILADLESGSEALEQHLAERRKKGRSFRTINADLVAVRSFCRWLMEKGCLRRDPTRGLHRLNVEEDRRLERRALTDAEAQRLIAVTFGSTREYKHLTGKDRSVMYTLAQRTGLRRKELRSLTPASFDLESKPPIVEVEASTSKRRKKDLLPLPDDLAETLQDYLANRPRDQRIWPGAWWRRSAEMLRLDLADAKIEAVDAQGLVVDFHGQRTTFITAMARAGVSPAIAQKLARHSDINLTMGTYTRLQVEDLAGAVEKLAELRPDIPIARQQPVPAVTDPNEAATDDPHLAAIIAAWPRLSVQVRQALLSLVQAASGDQKAP